ncbi:MAG: hypothetical protein LBS12_03705 [Prevotellaceae bacterium]|jgi:hypothetical protein|nr:hypothetical protein [Prevotellaceae bacterium]
MKKHTLFSIFAGLLLLTGACTNTVPNEDDDSDLGPIIFVKSYISAFTENPTAYRTHMVTGIKVDEQRKIVGIHNCRARWTVEETSTEQYAVEDGITLVLRVSDAEGGYFDAIVDPDYPNSEEYRIRDGYRYYLALLGDTLFNQWMRGETTIMALITPLQSITVTSDKPFGRDYPAGSDLSALFTVYFEDPRADVMNGYRQVEGTYSYVWQYPLSLFKARLSEADFAERPFGACEWLLFLDVAPEQTDEYTFLITVTSTDGTVVESVSPSVIIKGSRE